MTPDKMNPGLTKAPPAPDDDVLREPTKEEIMEDIRLGIQEAKAGEGMPAREAIEALLKRVYGDADAD